MKALQPKELENFINEGFICLYDNQRIYEYDVETDTIYFEDFIEDKKFSDIDFDYLVIFEQLECTSFTCDVEEIVKTIKKCIKEQKNFEQGKNCLCIIDAGSDICGVETLEKLLSDLFFLYDRINDLEICELKIVKG